MSHWSNEGSGTDNFLRATQDQPKLKNPPGGFVSAAQRQTIPNSVYAIGVRESSRQL